LNTKSKSFIEDTLILLVIGALLYGLYSFFFGSEDITDNSFENQTTIEKKIDIEKKEPLIINEEQKIITTTEDENQEVEEIKTIESLENLPEEIKEKVKEVQEEVIIEKLPEEIKEEISTPITIGEFYKSIEDKIYLNISRDVDKSIINNISEVNIRVTILKNGKYQQLKYMDGNKQYYNLIKPSILKVFPLEIDDSLKYKFPRYFRMKVRP